jgi:hypothetical protein
MEMTANDHGDLEIADDQSGISQPLSALSRPLDLSARHMADDDSEREEDKHEDQSRDRHPVSRPR